MLTFIQMIAQNAVRARLAASHLSRRAFSTTRTQQAGFHYPEGPRSNLPFNPLTRFFVVRYWTFCGTEEQLTLCWMNAYTGAAVGFGLPFGIAGTSFS
jgi:cytochrome c oxidase subunit 7c